MLPRTKIVATIGPACWEEETLRALLRAGVSVARFNFSHAEHKTAAEKMALVRRLAAEEGLCVAILADLQGPRIRVGTLPDSGLPLKPGDLLTLEGGEGRGPRETNRVPIDYPGLSSDVRPGDTILLDDGLIRLEVTGADAGSGVVQTRVLVGGTLTSHKGVNVPGRPLGVPTLTTKDRGDLRFALGHDADMVALSFVRTGRDVVEAKALIESITDKPVPVISKIEKGAAVDNFEEILAASDAIMVARGDLGVELPAEVLPGIQKRLIKRANMAAKPVITATQMLDSMVRNPRPTRAEATDVANAVLDGTDAVMLSGETAAGKYPLEAVETMARIALEAETLLDYEGWAAAAAAQSPAHEPTTGSSSDNRTIAEVICQAADHIAEVLGAKGIVALTQSGSSARLVAKYRPRGVLIAVTDRTETQRALAVTWGARPLLIGSFSDSLDMLQLAERQALESGLIAPGDLLVFTGDLPNPIPGQTTMLKVQLVSQERLEK